MFKFAFAALLVVTLMTDSMSAQEASLDDIIEAHVKALGGKEAILKVDNIERKAKASLEGSFGSMSGTATEIADIKGKRYYSDLDLGQYKKTQALVGDGGWFKGSDGEGDMSDQDIAFAKMNLGVSPLLSAFETSKGLLTVEGTEIFGDNECYTVAIGKEAEYFVGIKSNLLEGMKIADAVTISLSNYKETDGVQLPTKKIMNIKAQGITLEYTLHSTKINVEIDDSLFGDLAEPIEPDTPEYTAEQIIGFMDKDDDEKISEDEAGGLIKENFAAIDTNGDGFIDMIETNAMLAYTAQQKAIKKDKPRSNSVAITSKQIIASMDKNSDGKIAKDESNEELKPFFSEYDTDSDGYIDEKEGQAIADFVSGR